MTIVSISIGKLKKKKELDYFLFISRNSHRFESIRFIFKNLSRRVVTDKCTGTMKETDDGYPDGWRAAR